MNCFNCQNDNTIDIYPHVKRCLSCGFIYVDKEERVRQQESFILQEEYNDTVVENLSKKYPKDAHAKKDLYARIARELTKQIQRPARNVTVADIGASGGFFLYECEKLGVEASSLSSFEMSPNYIALTKQYFGYTGIQKNIEDIEEKEIYDIVTLFDVLEHIDDFEKALHGVHRSLRGNGLLYLKLPSGPSTYLKVRFAKALRKDALVPKILYLEPGGHLNYWSRKNIYHLERYGFTILHTSLVKPTLRQFKKRYLIYFLLYTLNTLLKTDYYPEFEVTLKKI
jgi:2-polyprenyl-3-methyl-5-hydroxy-6-metoxy-1,4-benzoquinol methylase